MSTGVPSPPRTPTGASAPAGTSPTDAPRPDALAPERASAAGRSRADPGARASALRPERWAPSPTFPRRELVLAILAGVGLAVLTSWPLVLRLPSRIAPDLGDPVRTAWQIAWVGHALLHDPLHLFNANAFYPHPLSLAFSDSLLGYGPAAFFGSGTVAALVRYNLLFLLAWSLCFVGAYLLARELGLGRVGAAAAGAAFAYAPYRITEAGHLHVISSGGIPLALFLLLRGYRRESRGLVLAGWLVSAWQVSLGFTLGLQFCYLLAVLAVLLVWHWWRAGRPAPPRRLLAVTCAGIAMLGAIAVYQARPYLRVSHDYPKARRSLVEVERYSAGPRALLAAPAQNRVWGGATASLRAGVSSKNESVFFPGAGILALALIGLIAGGWPRADGSRAGSTRADRSQTDGSRAGSTRADRSQTDGSPAGGTRTGRSRTDGSPWTDRSPYTRRLRLGLACGAVVCAVLALGLGLTGAGYPYRLLYNYAPGWDGVRVPGRVFTLATLFLALLAGAGAHLLARRARILGERHTLRGLPALVGCALVVLIVGEGAGRMAHPVVPQPARAEIDLPGPLLDLPTDGAADRVWQYFSTDGFPAIAQGNSTFDIPAEDDLRGGMSGFPDRASVEKLRYYGIRTVVLHLALPSLPGIAKYSTAEPPDVHAAAAKPVRGLGVTREQVGQIVIYRIGPGPKALHGSD